MKTKKLGLIQAIQKSEDPFMYYWTKYKSLVILFLSMVILFESYLFFLQQKTLEYNIKAGINEKLIEVIKCQRQIEHLKFK